MNLDPMTVITNLGIAGFAIWIMYKMFQSYQSRAKEKDQELIVEIDKRDRRNDELQRAFHEFATKTQESMNKHISENTIALTSFTESVRESTKVTHALSKHIAEHH